VLVIPREEVDHWDDASDALTAHLMQVSKKMAKAIKDSFSCKRVALIIAGLEVPHTHLHLVPVDSMEDLSFENVSMADAADLAAHCAKIKAQCA
jgi:diadenosine tetraphosphate (Ap4A) HIT family hydrolase